jgi:hypothetical protein
VLLTAYLLRSIGVVSRHLSRTPTPASSSSSSPPPGSGPDDLRAAAPGADAGAVLDHVGPDHRAHRRDGRANRRPGEVHRRPHGDGGRGRPRGGTPAGRAAALLNLCGGGVGFGHHGQGVSRIQDVFKPAPASKAKATKFHAKF